MGNGKRSKRVPGTDRPGPGGSSISHFPFPISLSPSLPCLMFLPMPYRPTIGIPTQTLHAIDGIPEGLPASWVMNQRYYYAATGAGAVPWMVPLLADDTDTLRLIYQRLDGILLAGGVDMDPTTFGERPHPKLGSVAPARARGELAV